jgi:uncharacterized protein
VRLITALKRPWADTGHSPGRRLDDLERAVHQMYIAAGYSLPFHGWHHVRFVTSKAVEFAEERGADRWQVATAALLHDLNYLVRKNSEPDAGRRLRRRFLSDTGYGQPEITQVEDIIEEAHTATRTARISPEGSALSDADTLFKALPTTPVVFSHLYLSENGIGLGEPGRKILDEQVPLVEQDIYFYDARLLLLRCAAA